MTHPLIEQFQTQAELLDIWESPETLDDAMATLAAWIDLTGPRLNQDDVAVLIGIGGVMYREGLRRRMA